MAVTLEMAHRWLTRLTPEQRSEPGFAQLIEMREKDPGRLLRILNAGQDLLEEAGEDPTLAQRALEAARYYLAEDEREERALMEALQKPSGLYIHGPRILAHAARKESRKHARTRKLPEKVPTPEEFSKLPRDEMHRQYRQLWEWMHGRPKGE